jgi:hypothetical protein
VSKVVGTEPQDRVLQARGDHAAHGRQCEPGRDDAARSGYRRRPLQALEVQAALWRGGKMRSVGLPDLLVAAVVERERVTVVLCDADYEIIAKVSG